MNITAELITSILTQAGEAITCKNLRTECDDIDIIVRFEDDTDTTISIFYASVEDLLVIGTMDSSSNYRVRARYRHASVLDHDILTKHFIYAIVYLELALELAHDTEEE